MTLIEVKHATFGYENRPVVQIQGLALRAGQCLGMFGPNGSGKTTLVRGITGLLPPMKGEVVRKVQIRVGYLPQHRGMELHWPMIAFDAASMALSARMTLGWIRLTSRETIRQKMRLLEVDDLSERRMASLSGGQQQRVLLAGALAADPQLLVLDEPTEGLDVRSRKILLRALRSAASGGLCTIMISHAIDDLIALCDQVAWFRAGEDPSQPTQVEVMPATELAARVAHLHQTA
jgi:ABC-type Mn2+/Zn2+ transport system ATPase subunit